MTDRASDRLTGYAPVPLFLQDGRLFAEDQSLIGLRRWAENFARVDMMMPLEHGPLPAGWSEASALDDLPGLTLHPLPAAYRPDRFARALPGTLPRIRALIAQPAVRSFAIGGLFGDWGAVACLSAHRAGLPFAVWTDRVESEVTRQGADDGPWRTRLRKRLTWRPMAALERAVIRRATVGLFHGRETHDIYAPHARAAEMVHDILIDRSDHIDAGALARKRAAAADGPLRIVYAGRADPMKGALDWVAALERLDALGVAFTATYLGDGPDLAAMRDRVAANGLAGRVTLPGFTADRRAVMAALRAAQAFLFCHRTPESPRNLIEALVSATPLVGYDGAYARDLTNGGDSGVFHPIGDTDGLAQALAGLSADRDALVRRIDAAKTAGGWFDSQTVFRHRSDMLRKHLG